MKITKARLRQIIKEELESLNKLREEVPPESQTRVSRGEIESAHRGVDKLVAFLKRSQDTGTLHKAINSAWKKGVFGPYAPAKPGTSFNQRSRAEKTYWKLINRVVKVKKEMAKMKKSEEDPDSGMEEFVQIKKDLNVMVANYKSKQNAKRAMATGGRPSP